MATLTSLLVWVVWQVLVIIWTPDVGLALLATGWWDRPRWIAGRRRKLFQPGGELASGSSCAVANVDQLAEGELELRGCAGPGGGIRSGSEQVGVTDGGEEQANDRRAGDDGDEA